MIHCAGEFLLQMVRAKNIIMRENNSLIMREEERAEENLTILMTERSLHMLQLLQLCLRPNL